jgi:hypothetical protein
MTHHVILPSSNDALQKSKLPWLSGKEHGLTIPLADIINLPRVFRRTPAGQWLRLRAHRQICIDHDCCCGAIG